jgi:hypothetical protein
MTSAVVAVDAGPSVFVAQSSAFSETQLATSGYCDANVVGTHICSSVHRCIQKSVHALISVLAPPAPA